MDPEPMISSTHEIPFPEMEVHVKVSGIVVSFNVQG